MAIPTRLFSTNSTEERCTSRATSSTSAAATLTTRPSRRSRVETKAMVNSRVGTAASSMPRRPPRAWESRLRTTSSTVPVPTGVAVGTRLLQLVAGVEHHPRLVLHADPADDLDRASRLDAGDPPTTQPDEGDQARAVVQLGLERGHSATGPEGHRAQAAAQLHALPVVGLDDRAAAGLDGVLL